MHCTCLIFYLGEYDFCGIKIILTNKSHFKAYVKLELIVNKIR